MSVYIGDMETNAIPIPDVKVIHCIVLIDLLTDEVLKFGPTEIDQAISVMSKADSVVFHNWYGYDGPVIKKFYPNFTVKKAEDTLILSRLFYPERLVHSIESYGAEFGIPKPEHEEWGIYTPEMLHRCTEDTRIGKLVYERCLRELIAYPNWEAAIADEYRVAEIHKEQITYGVHINQPLIHSLVSILDERTNRIYKEILPRLPYRCIKGSTVNKVFKKNGEYQQYVNSYFEG